MKKKEKFFYFLMICIAFFGCLLLTEGYFRFIRPHRITYVNINGHMYSLNGIPSRFHYTFDPLTGYALIPNIDDAEQRIQTDQYGFRKTGKPIDPDKGSIIFVGDSTVFGWGVGDSDTFCYRIAQNDVFKDYNIINMGVPAYSIGHIKEVLKKKVAKFNPKIVFVAILWPWKPFDSYSTKDAWKEVDYEFYRKTIPMRSDYVGNPRSLIRQITPRTFFVIRDFLLRNKYRDQIQENLIRPGIRDFQITESEEIKLAAEHVAVLKDAIKELSEKGTKVIFYIHPYQYTVFHENYQDLGKAGKEVMIAGLNAVDMSDYLKEKFNGESMYLDGSHLSAIGHKYYADYFSSMAENIIKSFSD